MNESLRPTMPQQGCFEIAITVFLLVFVAFPMSLYQMAKEKTLETVADMAMQNIDVVILTESNDTITDDLLRCADPGEAVAEFDGCWLCPVELHTALPVGYVKPEYLQVQDNGSRLFYLVASTKPCKRKSRYSLQNMQSKGST